MQRIRKYWFIATVALLTFTIVVYTLFKNIIFLGDKLIKEDHVRRANIVYEIAKTIYPNDPKINTRLKITKALLGYGNVIDSGLTRTNTDLQDFYQDNYGAAVPILLYHYIRIDPNENDIFGKEMSVSAVAFDKQMNYLISNGFNILTIDDLRNAYLNNTKLPERSVVITIDDGYEDLYSAAFPILKKYNIPAEAFIITEFVGGPNYLTWDEIINLESSGLITFGSHTLDHTPLTIISDNQLKDELSESKKQLESRLKKPVEWLAYPYGITNPTVEKVASESGYLGTIGIYHDGNDSSNKMVNIPRIIIKGSDTLESFAKIVNLQN